MRFPSSRVVRLLPLAFVLLAGPFAAPSPRRADAAEPTLVESRSKRVLVYSTVPWLGLGKAAAEAADAALAVYEEHLPYRLPDAQKLVFRIYASAEEYVAGLKSVEGGQVLAQTTSATSFKTMETYLVAQPRSDMRYLTLVGELPEALRFELCREGLAQFVLRAKAPGCAFWPDWYAVGMSDFLAERCLAAAAAKDAPPSLLIDDRRDGAKSLLEHGRWLRTDRALYASRFESADNRPLYAAWDALYRLMASDAEKAKALHLRIRDLGEPPVPEKGETDRRMLLRSRACADALAAVYGPPEGLDGRVRELVAAAKPTWFEPLRSTSAAASSTRDGPPAGEEEWVCASRPDRTAIAIRSEPAPKDAYAVKCKMWIVDPGEGSRHEPNVFLQGELYFAFEDRESPRFLKVAFGDHGVLALLPFANGAFQHLYEVDVPLGNEPERRDLLRYDRWVALRLEVDRERIKVFIDDQAVLDTTVPPGFDALGTQVGIGASTDVVRYRGFEVVPLGR